MGSLVFRILFLRINMYYFMIHIVFLLVRLVLACLGFHCIFKLNKPSVRGQEWSWGQIYSKNLVKEAQLAWYSESKAKTHGPRRDSKCIVQKTGGDGPWWLPRFPPIQSSFLWLFDFQAVLSVLCCEFIFKRDYFGCKKGISPSPS